MSKEIFDKFLYSIHNNIVSTGLNNTEAGRHWDHAWNKDIEYKSWCGYPYRVLLCVDFTVYTKHWNVPSLEQI